MYLFILLNAPPLAIEFDRIKVEKNLYKNKFPFNQLKFRLYPKFYLIRQQILLCTVVIKVANEIFCILRLFTVFRQLYGILTKIMYLICAKNQLPYRSLYDQTKKLSDIFTA